jgi:Co/Zn/Cd efflux system component
MYEHIEMERVGNMSEEGGFGLALVERFLGLILVIIGALAVYFTFISTQILDVFAAFFGFLSIIPLVLGLLLLTAKIE